MPDEFWSDEEWRAAMSTAEINDLPDSAFAHIEAGGTKDEEGKTTPRNLRHYPVHDKAHAVNALARANGQIANGDDDAKAIAKAALPKIKDAVEKFSGNGARTTRPFKKARHRAGPARSLELRRLDGLELRDSGQDIVELTGTPIVYNSPYKVRDSLGYFEERMMPGVVTDLIAAGCDTRFLIDHDPRMILARTASGTMTLEDTPRGLTFVARIDTRSTDAANLLVAVSRGDVSQMSVGMVVGDDQWDAKGENRTINKLAALEDVSAVTYPASPTTDISVRTQRMLLGNPVESRERWRKIWEITRDIHDGRAVDPASIDLLSDTARSLAEAEESFVDLVDETSIDTEVVDDESRAEPTPQDKGVTSKLQALAQAHHDAVAAQMKDPDNATDPADQALMGHLQDIGKLIGKAQATQAVDAASDIPLVGGPDGTLGNGQASAETVPQDATGVARKRTTTKELEDELRQQKRAQELRDIKRAREEREKRERETRNKP